jgi:hypothetical protein
MTSIARPLARICSSSAVASPSRIKSASRSGREAMRQHDCFPTSIGTAGEHFKHAAAVDFPFSCWFGGVIRSSAAVVEEVASAVAAAVEAGD